jgi:D-alanyl-D-alanine carboxypeptidase
MNNILSRFAAAVGALLLALGLPLTAMADALSPAQVAKVDAIIKEGMAKQHLVGVAVAVGRNGTTLFAKGYGLRDKANNLPVTGNTIFPTGSIGKQFTAACVMLLVEQGKVKLDNKVATYLPNAPHGSEITVRQLLNQTSGLHDYLENKALLSALFGGKWLTHRPSSFYVGLMANDPLAFKPGTKWQYSNTNYELLGMLVAKVSGESYENFVTQNIFKAHNLDSMQYLTWSIPVGDDVTRGYNFANGEQHLIPRYDMSWGGSAGALASNAPDLVKWDGAFFGGQVITPASVIIATTPPHGITMGLPAGNTQSQIAEGYGFGWVIGHDEGRKIIWHNGGIVGGRTMNAVFPTDGLEVIILTNATTADPEVLALKIARLLYGG